MKNILTTSALLIFVAGAAAAAGNQTRERADPNPVPVMTAQKVDVNASSIHSTNKELARAGLMSNDSVKVTIFQSTGMIDMRSRDN